MMKFSRSFVLASAVLAAGAVGCAKSQIIVPGQQSDSAAISALQNAAGCLDMSKVDIEFSKAKKARETLVDAKVDGSAPSKTWLVSASGMFLQNIEPNTPQLVSASQDGCSSVTEQYSDGSTEESKIVKSGPKMLQLDATSTSEGIATTYKETYELVSPTEIKVTYQYPFSWPHICNDKQIDETHTVSLVDVEDFGNEMPPAQAESKELQELRKSLAAASSQADPKNDVSQVDREYCSAQK